MRFSIDRFEGDHSEIAVVLDQDGHATSIPKHWLPADARAGDALIVTIERDAEHTNQVAEKTRAVQDQLKAGDTGEDLSL